MLKVDVVDCTNCFYFSFFSITGYFREGSSLKRAGQLLSFYLERERGHQKPIDLDFTPVWYCRGILL